jgi:hypothetical protein
LSRQASKRKADMLARWERPKGVSRSKWERIDVKMELCSNAGERSIKRDYVWSWKRGEGEYTVASQKYTPVPRARGTTK